MVVGSENVPVTPAHAGTHVFKWLRFLDSRVRGNDAEVL